MPYVRRKSRKRRRAPRKYTRRKRKASVKTVRAIVKRALRPMQKVVRLYQHYTWGQLISPVVIQNVSKINTAEQVFDTEPDDLHANQCKLLKKEMKIVITADTEKDYCGISIYVVSLKNSVADADFDALTGVLNLTSGKHYKSGQGLTFVNPHYFNIMFRRDISFSNLSATNTSTGAFSGSTRTYSKILRLNHLIRNPVGNWHALNHPNKPSQNIYVLAFNNNSGLDLESPYIYINVLDTFVTS